MRQYLLLSIAGYGIGDSYGLTARRASQCLDLEKRLHGIGMLSFGFRDQRRDVRVQRVHTRIGMSPSISVGGGV